MPARLRFQRLRRMVSGHDVLLEGGQLRVVMGAPKRADWHSLMHVGGSDGAAGSSRLRGQAARMPRGAACAVNAATYGVLRYASPLRVTAPLSVAFWRCRDEGRSGKISTACGASNKGHALVWMELYGQRRVRLKTIESL
jgi:hypothetical protein